ncbi:hypothetical protein AB4072_08420 [Microvirga sp. 2MCAF38]|uniref:hypothetical protein n=1 Tax=Microvirga sp. 2MCAF38 TaxID=3232989 RepID=UPI003F94B348
MKNVNLERERRKQNAFERLGTHKPTCPTCGETHFACFEEHHIAGRKYDATTWPICANCHRKVTDAQKDHPSFLTSSNRQLETIGRFLLGLADLLSLAVEKLVEFGRELIERAVLSQDGEVR